MTVLICAMFCLCLLSGPGENPIQQRPDGQVRLGPAETGTQNSASLMAWLESLEFPSARHLPFVRIQNGPARLDAVGGWHRDETFGFLVYEDDSTIRIRDMYLQVREFPKSANRPHRGIKIQLEDIETYTELILDGSVRGDCHHHIFGEVCLPATLALACRQKGRHELAARLLDFVLFNGNTTNIALLKEEISEIIASEAASQIFAEIRDPRVSREQLFTRTSHLCREFPESESLKELSLWNMAWKSMLQEDSSLLHQLSARVPYDRLSPQAQAKVQVYLLRDQICDKSWHEEKCNVNFSERNSPARRLTRLGFDAVPALIAALGDPRPTRSLSLDERGRATGDILSVGEAAHQILCCIAGRQFFVDGIDGKDARPDDLVNARQEAARWFAEAKRLGEERHLVKLLAISSLRQNSAYIDLSERLVTKYPATAIALMQRGNIVSPTHRYVVSELLGNISPQSLLSPDAVLLDEWKYGRTRSDQYTAAISLLRRGNREILQDAINSFETAVTEDPTDAELQFFLCTKDRRAIEVFNDRFASLRTPIQSAILIRLANEPIFDLLDYGTFGITPTVSNSELKEAYELFLINCLEVTEQSFTVSPNFPAFRVCDIAGELLHRLDPVRYPFDGSALYWTRETQRLAILECSRSGKDCAEPTLSFQQVTKSLVTNRQIANLLPDRLVQADSERQHCSILASESSGSFKGWMQTFSKKFGKNIANVVVDVQFDVNSLRPGKAIRAEFDCQIGKPLDLKVLERWSLMMRKDIEPKWGAYQIRIVRAPGEGVKVIVDIQDRERCQQIATCIGSPMTSQQEVVDTWNYGSFVKVEGSLMDFHCGQHVSPPELFCGVSRYLEAVSLADSLEAVVRIEYSPHR